MKTRTVKNGNLTIKTHITEGGGRRGWEEYSSAQGREFKKKREKKKGKKGKKGKRKV